MQFPFFSESANTSLAGLIFEAKHENSEMLATAFITAFIVYFIKATTWKGMIFYEISLKLRGALPEKLRKPLFECPICMTPWWGILIYLAGYYLDIPEFAPLTLQRVIFTVFTAAGINTILLIVNKIYDTIHEEAEESK